MFQMPATSVEENNDDDDGGDDYGGDDGADMTFIRALSKKMAPNIFTHTIPI